MEPIEHYDLCEMVPVFGGVAWKAIEPHEGPAQKTPAMLEEA